MNKLARALALGVVAFAGGSVTQALQASNSAHASSIDDSPYGAMAQLGRVLVTVESEYVEPVDRTKIVNGAIEGMVAGLDPHSSYMSPQDFALFQSDTQGEFGGVGIEVDAKNDVLTVIAPIEGSPAERAGVKSGDKLLAVDGETAAGIGLDKMVRKMRGRPGTHVKLTVRRASVAEPITFDLVREIIKVRSVSSRMLKDGVAYVRIKQFQDKTHDELLEAVARLRREARESNGRITGVLIDMRSNPGGLVDEAAEVADELLAGGTIYSARHRGQIVDDVKAHGGGALVDVPAVVLVNAFPASAAELVTGALQDAKRATVVGQQTFGKGSVQTIFELPGGAGMRLTTERYYTPSGHAIQADGIHPDVVVALEEGSPLPPVRERDLEGHLDAEERGGARAGHAAVIVDAGATDASEDLSFEPSEGSVAKNVPFDPSASSDAVLKIGYGMLTKGR